LKIFLRGVKENLTLNVSEPGLSDLREFCLEKFPYTAVLRS